MDQHLVVFIEVVETKSFTEAAKRLHMTQPAVSQSVMSLEQRLGTKLIERSNKQFFVNKAGEIVYAYGKKITANYEQMENLVSELENEPSGKILIGASYTIGEYLLPKVLPKLHNTYPKITPHILIDNTEEIGRKLVNHEIDIGLIEGEFIDAKIDSEVFATDQMYIFGTARQNLLVNTPITNEDLSEFTWIIREKGSGTRIVSEQFIQENRITPNRILTFGSTQIIKEAVESGLGISLISEWAIKKEVQLGTVKKLQVVNTPIKRSFSIIKIKQEFETKAVKAFKSLLKKSK